MRGGMVMLDSANDTILFTRDAKSRVGFAEGAVRAAEWIKGKTGFYEFPEIVDSALRKPIYHKEHKGTLRKTGRLEGQMNVLCV